MSRHLKEEKTYYRRVFMRSNDQTPDIPATAAATAADDDSILGDDDDSILDDDDFLLGAPAKTTGAMEERL